MLFYLTFVANVASFYFTQPILIRRKMLSLLDISMDHSFPRYAEFWAEPQNLPVSAEFCGIL